MTAVHRARPLLMAALLAVAPALGPLVLLAPAAAGEGDCQNLLEGARKLVQEAEARYDQGDIPKSKAAAIQALPLAEQAFARCPGNLDACSMGVFAAVFENDFTQGRIWLERYVASAPYGERDPHLHYLRALVQARLVHRYDLALRSLERMHAIEPRLDPRRRDNLYLDTLMAYGVALGKESKYDDALRQFHTAAVVARRLGNVRREHLARANAGIILSRDERYREAGDVFLGLHKDAPDNPVWSYQLGLALASQGRWVDAIESYRKSLAKQAGFPLEPEVQREIMRARLRLGVCLKNLAATLEPSQRAPKLHEALRELEAYREARPEDRLAHLWIGVLLYEERDFAGAVGPLRKAFEMDRMCENALRFLLNAHSEVPTPPKPDGTPATPEEVAAWKAERAALQEDLEKGKEQRLKAIAARTAETGDQLGGCL